MKGTAEIPGEDGSIVRFVSGGGRSESVGFLARSNETGRFVLRTESIQEMWGGLPVNVSGLCRGHLFLLYGGRVSIDYEQLNIAASDLFVSMNRVGSEVDSEESGLCSLLDNVGKILFQIVPESVAATFRLGSGIPIAFGGKIISNLDYSRFEGGAVFVGSSATVSLYRMSAHFDDRFRGTFANSSEERLTLGLDLPRPMKFEEVKLVAKAVRILLAYVEGDAAIDGVQLITSPGFAADWANAALTEWGQTWDGRPSIRVDISELPAGLELIHDFVFKMLETPHVIEVLTEILASRVASRYQITLLGTAWEHVVANMDEEVKVRECICRFVSEATDADSDSKFLVDLAWNTYNKLKHRQLRRKGVPGDRRLTIDDFNEDHASALARFMKMALVVAVFSQLGRADIAQDIGENIRGSVDHELSSYGNLARAYKVGSDSDR
ncbi:hypothetical protein [Nocardia carnea]|uniref:hypothetical protein n=1 Tax=Nocardia carnea TaxID=37328 RepID=UPI002458D376|nr:hypothetical protein [Nocardia carnea]